MKTPEEKLIVAALRAAAVFELEWASRDRQNTAQRRLVKAASAYCDAKGITHSVEPAPHA